MQSEVIKFTLIILLLTVHSISVSQTTTYSKEEEKMELYLNMGWAYATKYDSLENVKPVIDSCWRFLKKYPHSFLKPGVFQYLLKMTSVISTNLNEINPLIDSVLFYDKLPVTRLDIGDVLINRNLDVMRGRLFVEEALPNLTVDYHKFRSYMLLAKTDLMAGNRASGQVNIEKALQIDSTQYEAWFQYLSFFKMTEQTDEAERVQNIINRMQQVEMDAYANNATASSNIYKSINHYVLNDINGKPVEFKQFSDRVIVLNLFNFWCNWCVKEFPTLKKLIKEFPEVKFIFVDCLDTPDELKHRYFKKPEFSFLHNQTVVFEDSVISRGISGYAVPHTLVADKSGKIRYDYLGYYKNLHELLRGNIKKLLREK